MTNGSTGIERAAAHAEAVARAVRANGSIDPAIAALENSLAAYLNGGGSVDDVVPGGDPSGLGFGRKAGTGRSYVEPVCGGAQRMRFAGPTVN